MYGIGQFAQLAHVSLRTLRHYDEIGLLRPATVDPTTGYRFYRAGQLRDLNRILGLKDLGFTLAEITRLVEEQVTTEQMLGMLRLRRADAERAAAEERRRLDRVAARIQLLEGEPEVNDLDTAIVVKPLPALHLVVASEPVDGFDVEFGPIFGPLYARLGAALEVAGVVPTGPSVALYEEQDDGRIDVVAALQIPPDAQIEADGVSIRHLPPIDRAATLVYHGPMSGCGAGYQRLEQWMSAAGERPVGFSRELYLDCDGDPESWVTELQFVLGP
ncbi:MAG: MerR family transcriptional regulator [Ilumatobacteraceae bacterium]